MSIASAMSIAGPIFVGIDDTDIVGSKGTNQLARAIVQALADRYACSRIVRHQLLDDPRVPYTSKNGSASMTLEPHSTADIAGLIETCRRVMREWFIEGSDPGLCVAVNGAAECTPHAPREERGSHRAQGCAPPSGSITRSVMSTLSEFGWRCQREVVSQQDARELASAQGIHLEGLGGTEGGVIGALAAVGLAATSDDGRIVQLGRWPDDLCGLQPFKVLQERNVKTRDIDTDNDIEPELVDLGKRLRPNVRGGQNVLFVRRSDAVNQAGTYQAVKLP